MTMRSRWHTPTRREESAPSGTSPARVELAWPAKPRTHPVHQPWRLNTRSAHARHRSATTARNHGLLQPILDDDSRLASTIQGSARLVTDRVVPVFGRGAGLPGSRRVVSLPDVLGRAPAPTAPGRAPFWVVGTGWLVRRVRAGAQPLPARQECLLPRPGPADLQHAGTGVADQPGGQRPQPVAQRARLGVLEVVAVVQAQEPAPGGQVGGDVARPAPARSPPPRPSMAGSARPIALLVLTWSSTTACSRCRTSIELRRGGCRRRPPIPPAAGMLVTVVEYRQAVARWKPVRFGICRRWRAWCGARSAAGRPGDPGLDPVRSGGSISADVLVFLRDFRVLVRRRPATAVGRQQPGSPAHRRR